jgi:beta-alanine--pyruvate transaminase
MGAVFAGRHVHDAIVQGPKGAIELFHGYTYSGHPAACAAGLATLDVYRREGLLTRAADLAPGFEAALHALRDRPHVIDVRNIGLMAGIELAPRDGAPGARGLEAHVKAFHAGALIRYTGDTIALSPPLIATPAELERLAGIVGEVLETIA